MRYEIGCANRLGNRTSNQDRLTAIESEAGVLLVLADGMGGLEQGEIAAQAVVDIASELYLKSPTPCRKPAVCCVRSSTPVTMR